MIETSDSILSARLRNLSLATCIALTGCASALAQNPDIPKAAGSNQGNPIEQALSICLSGLNDTAEATKIASQQGWKPPTKSDGDLSDKSLYLVTAAPDPTLLATFYYADSTAPRRGVAVLNSAQLELRAFAYPHIEIRNCSVTFIDMAESFDFVTPLKKRGWTGEVRSIGDGEQSFGDASIEGRWSFVTELGEVVGVDANRTEGAYISIQMTKYRQTKPVKE